MANLTNLNTNYFPTASETYTSNLSLGIAAGATTVPVNSAAGYEEGEVVTLTVDPKTPNEATFTGKRTGNSYTEVVWTEGNTAVGHNAGAVVADYISATHISQVSKGLLKEHNQDGTHKAVLLDTLKGAIFAAIYPVGSIYTNASNPANPSTLLGFGTWVAHGQGRVNVGVSAGETEFDTIGKTGGAKTHVLSQAEMPSHSHHVNDPGHSHGYDRGRRIITNIHNNQDGAHGINDGHEWVGSQHVGTGIWLNNAGSNAAHNNLQPYVTVYMWVRTA